MAGLPLTTASELKLASLVTAKTGGPQVAPSVSPARTYFIQPVAALWYATAGRPLTTASDAYKPEFPFVSTKTGAFQLVPSASSARIYLRLPPVKSR